MDTRATVILASVPAHNRFALFKKLRDGHHLHRQAMGCHWIIIRLVFKPGPRMAALPSISSHGHGIYRDPPNSLHGIHDLPFSHQPKERHDFLPAPSHFRHCPMARVSMRAAHTNGVCLFCWGLAIMGVVSPCPDYLYAYQLWKYVPKRAFTQTTSHGVYWFKST